MVPGVLLKEHHLRNELIYLNDVIMYNFLTLFAMFEGGAVFKFSQKLITEWPSNFATFIFYFLDVLLQNFNEFGGHLYMVLGVLSVVLLV